MGPWFEQQRGGIAALLTQEHDASRVSEQEVQESTQYHYSYYASDLVVVDWDPDDYTRTYELQTSEDGEAWTSAYRATRGNSGRDYLYSARQ